MIASAIGSVSMTDTSTTATSTSEASIDAVLPRPTLLGIPDAVVAVYTNEADLTDAIRHLERERYDMSSISVLGKGMSQERHVVGFETADKRTARWATWGGLWGWVFGALFFIPGLGQVAVGGYLLFMLATAGIGAVGGAITGALTGLGIPRDGIPIYEADLRADRFLVIAHGSPGDVLRARDLLSQTAHERLDHHQATAHVTAG
jgi:uncharacterized membrane protein